MALPISILKNIMDFKCMHIEKIEIQKKLMHSYGETYIQDVVAVHARPFKRKQCLCQKCKKKCVRNGHKQVQESYWRAPNLNGTPVFILYRPQRILCPEHGSVNEYIPWADGKSRFTASFNNEIAWLTCQMSKSAICVYENINWRTVGNCLKAAHSRLEPDVSARIHDNVRRICVDETSYSKGYKYITVVYDMDKNKVIWIDENHGQSVFEKFCLELTEEERDRIEIVAGDGAKWIDECTKQYFKNAVRCVDFFHVVQWANEALDNTRRNIVSKAKREYENLKTTYKKAENEEAEAAAKAEESYQKALQELMNMPQRGRPSKKKRELMNFVIEYAQIDSLKSDTTNKRSVGRPKKEIFSPEHEAELNNLSDKIKNLKGSRYALGHVPGKCTASQTEKLQMIENSNPDLYRAYQLKEALRIILHMKDYELAENELYKWIADAETSGLKHMVKLSEKIERHKDNILNSIKHGANSAKSESTNTTIKFLIKLARGFKSMENMFALIYLKCSDIIIPLSNRPQPTKEYLKAKRERANELKMRRSVCS